jgi:hypothetical protein
VTFLPVAVIQEVSAEEAIPPPDPRSVLIGYLLGQRASEEPGLIRDELALRAWARNALHRIPESLYGE